MHFIMTLMEALNELINSKEFNDMAKRKDIPEGNKYRQYRKRFKENTLGKAAIVELLESNGYIISADKAEKISPSK